MVYYKNLASLSSHILRVPLAWGTTIEVAVDNIVSAHVTTVARVKSYTLQTNGIANICDADMTIVTNV